MGINKFELFKLGEYTYHYGKLDMFTYYYKSVEDRFSGDPIFQIISKDELDKAWDKAQWLYPTPEREKIEEIKKWL